jgi:ABC-type amino acid transport substrate-binding protein
VTFLNDKNELTGYDIEVGRFIANHLGVKLDLVRLDWKGILPGLQTGRFDLVFSIPAGVRGDLVKPSSPFEELAVLHESCESFIYTMRSAVTKARSEDSANISLDPEPGMPRSTGYIASHFGKRE